MRDFSDEIRYGFSLYPFAITIAVGFLLVNTGPTLYQSLMSSVGVTSRSVLLAGMLLIQLLGAVSVAAGFFGGLYRTIRDAKE